MRFFNLALHAARKSQISSVFQQIFGWNDLGSWTALHEHHASKSQPQDGNLVAADAFFALNAIRNHHPREICGRGGR